MDKLGIATVHLPQTQEQKHQHTPGGSDDFRAIMEALREPADVVSLTIPANSIKCLSINNIFRLLKANEQDFIFLR